MEHMKGKIILGASIVVFVAFVICASIFFSADMNKVTPLYDKVIEALDEEHGLKELFLDETLEKKADIMDEKIETANDYYEGKSVDISKFKIYRESASYYRAYAVVKTDAGKEYFVSAALSGARSVDPLGVKQVIIDDRGKHHKKNFFKAEKFKDYLKKSTDYGVSLRY